MHSVVTIFETEAKQDGRLSPVYFRPPILFKMLFKNDESVFSIKNFLIFARKTSKLRWKRHFKEIIPFDSHSTANLL